ncbi:MAG: LuxR C-terminal-related transcriptional regulator [Caldilineaceae bacterium]
MARIAELKQLSKELYGIDLQQAGTLLTELTAREWEVLQLIEQGYSNQQIADKLTIEMGTVKNHVHKILDKLDVRCREQAGLARSPALYRTSRRTRGGGQDVATVLYLAF